jgi:hypothetical protein
MWQDSDITGGKVRLKFSSVEGETIGASGLVPGEVAVNVADGKIFYKDDAGLVHAIPPTGFTGTATINAEEFVFVDGILTAITPT